MPGIGDILQSKTGRTYRLVGQLGKGGEGTVYSTDDSRLVAKIYHPNKITDELERKLLCMLRNPIDPMAGMNRLLIAWPQDVIYSNGRFAGYVMPLVENTHPIYVVCRNNEKHRHDCHEVFPDYDWRHSLMVAYHLAWTVAYVHRNGYVIGDMNSNNIVVHRDGTITLLDVDSFDVTDPDTGDRFPCTVGICEFLAPELQGRNLTWARFTRQSDEFSLAVHIFILLMNSFHPFTMRHLAEGERYLGNVHTLTGAKTSTVQDQRMANIVNGCCPYIRDIPGYGIPLPAPQFSMLPGKIQECFRRTFDYDQMNAIQRINERTSADEWRQQLFQYFLRLEDDPKTGRKADLIRCSENPEHFYLRSRGHCAFCAAAMRMESAMVRVNTIPDKQPSQPVQKEFGPWEAEILSATTRSRLTRVSEPIREGDTAYVYFRISRGPEGEKTALRYCWSIDGRNAPIVTMEGEYGASSLGCIAEEKVAPGTHTVILYDSAKRELARICFQVLGKYALVQTREKGSSAQPPQNDPPVQDRKTAFPVVDVKREALWGVEIASVTTEDTITRTSRQIHRGEKAYVYFHVLRGPVGQKTRLRYSWKWNNEFPVINRISNTYIMDDWGCIYRTGLPAGTHTVVIYDSRDQELARVQFSVT